MYRRRKPLETSQGIVDWGKVFIVTQPGSPTEEQLVVCASKCVINARFHRRIQRISSIGRINTENLEAQGGGGQRREFRSNV